MGRRCRRATVRKNIGRTDDAAYGVDYTSEAVYRETDIQRYLTVHTAGEGVRLRYALTPFTTLGVSVERYRNRFPFTPDRDSDGTRVTTVVEFKPLADVSGSAEVGIIRRTFVDQNAPPYRGSVARADLGYRLFGRTRFGFAAERDL